jgi:hypothetical protein
VPEHCDDADDVGGGRKACVQQKRRTKLLALRRVVYGKAPDRMTGIG